MAGYVQSLSAVSGTSTTETVTLSSAVTAHNLLVADVFWGSATDTCSVADTNGNSWTPLGSPQVGGGAGNSFQQFYVLDANAGSTPVTATVSGSVSYIGLAVTEASVATTPAVFDTSAYQINNSAGPNNATTKSISPATSGEYIHAAMVVDNNIFSVDSPFTMEENTNWGFNGVADYSQTTAASISATFQGSYSAEVDGIIAFKSFVAAPPNGGFFRLMR